MKLSLSHNFPQIERQLKQLREDIAKKATVRAINRTAEQGKTEMSRRIRQEFNVTTAKVREKLFLKKAIAGGRLTIQAVLESRDPRGRRRSINVINFAGRQVAKGVSVKVKKGGGRKVIRNAFVGNKGRTVFARQGKQRLPISPVQAIDIQQMFNTRRIKNAVIAKIKEVFPRVFQREVAFYTQRFGR